MAVASQVSIATHTTNKHQTLQGSCKKILINERLRQKKQQQKKQETEPHWKKPSAPAYKTAVFVVKKTWTCLGLSDSMSQTQIQLTPGQIIFRSPMVM